MIRFARLRRPAVWIFALTALGVNTAVSIFNVVELIDNNAQVDHTRNVIIQLQLLLADLTDAETGQRGFLITGNDAYLLPFRDGLQGIGPHFDQVQTLTLDNPDQQRSLLELKELIARRVSTLILIIPVRGILGADYARELVIAGRGNEMMASIRALMEVMHERENVLLVKRTATARAKVRATIFTTALGGLLTLAMTGTAFLLIRSELKRRKLAEVELRVSENDLRATADVLATAQRHSADALALLESFLTNAPIGFAFLDVDLRFVRLNEPFCETDGSTINAHIGRRITDLTSTFAVASVNDLRQVLETRQAIVDRVINDATSNSEQPRNWQATYFPILGPERLLGVGVIVREITSRLQHERALRESQARFRSLAESMPQFVWVARADGFAEYFNQRWYDYTGLTQEETLGFRWGAPLHADDRERAEQQWKQATATGEAYEIEYRIGDKQGHYRWFLSRALPQKNDAGRIVNWFGTNTDIHDRKEAEYGLQRSMERFRYLAESIPQMVWTSAPGGDIEFYNQRWIEYTGIAPEQARTHGWNEVVHPDDRDKAVAQWLDDIQRGISYQAELRVRSRHDGSYRWHLVSAAAIRDESGNIVQWVGTLTDIDDRKRQTEALEQLVRARTAALSQTNAALEEEVEVRKLAEQKEHEAARELRRSNQELEQFAYVASHDLQEPLRKIQAFGDRLRQKFDRQLGEQGQEYLDRITSSATRMRTLINDLLSFSRVATRGHSFREIDLSEVARGVLSDLEERILQTGGRVVVSPLPRITGDALQIQQLFQNLIGNALKFHRPDVPPRVTVRGEIISEASPLPDQAARDVCRLEFTDNGIGFDEKYRERIFQVFQRLHGRGQYEGTGIGLAICRKIVERHGGNISATSVFGAGAVFVVILPVLPATSPEGDSSFG